jgi:hypothetical protein
MNKIMGIRNGNVCFWCRTVGGGGSVSGSTGNVTRTPDMVARTEEYRRGNYVYV